MWCFSPNDGSDVPGCKVKQGMRGILPGAGSELDRSGQNQTTHVVQAITLTIEPQLVYNGKENDRKVTTGVNPSRCCVGKPQPLKRRQYYFQRNGSRINAAETNLPSVICF